MVIKFCHKWHKFIWTMGPNKENVVNIPDLVFVEIFFLSHP